MEYFVKIIKKTGVQSLISSIIFAILGIILIIAPETTVKVISYMLGIMFMLVGIYKIISYFSNKGNYDFYNYDMAFGIIAIILGIITIAYSREIGTIFRILIGLWIIYSSIIRFSLSMKLKTLGTNIWSYSLFIAIIMFICGIYTLMTSNIIVMTIGVVILIYAILDIIESIIFLSNMKDI